MSYRYRIALVFLTGFFIDCINIFMPAVALPRLAAEFDIASLDTAWVGNAYILGLTLVIPISTWLASRWGARRLLATSMLVFALAVAACGMAGSFTAIMGWRFVQGMAGGLLIPVGQAMAFALFQGAERARISTLVMAVALIAPALSPGLGGLIVDSSSWRWVFFANIPLALAAALLAWCWVRDGVESSKSSTVAKPDMAGLLLISIALAAVLLGMSLYGAGHGWGGALLCLVVGLAAGSLYMRHSRRMAAPVVELRLLHSPRLRVSMAVYYAVPGVFTGVNLLSLFFLQDLLALSAQRSGMFMLVYAGGALLAMLLCGRIYNRVGARPLFVASLLLHSLGIACLMAVNSAGDVATLVLAYALMGLGGGLAANAAQTTALMDFHGADMPQASVIWNINRQMAFSVGAALFLMIFNLLQPHTGALLAYHASFAAAALTGLLPLTCLHTLKEKHV
ncbi:MAG: MFS transporter [Comamonas sp.]|jgi:EmrB/QacA subfamily drug resistance transporter|uniref:MFS transporter n=1 Tax=Comamonas sp. TaxID=34028 RepID=UPI002816A73F|nr:MFS transporter [Comamonas sp.]MDR0216868.1 MFS transporter [Comamonas sp.]